MPDAGPHQNPVAQRSARRSADKSYNAKAIRRLLAHWGYRVLILSRGEKTEYGLTPGCRARRWVVERTHVGFHRLRRLLIR